MACFRCDGTGELCNLCGESPTDCGCSVEDVEDFNGCSDQYDECPDCEGTGE